MDNSVLIHGLPALTLLDGRRFLFSSALGPMGMMPLDLFPVAFLTAVEVEKVNASPMYETDSPDGVVNLRLNWNYSGGEIGVFYGRSSGKFGREDKQAYISSAASEMKNSTSQSAQITRSRAGAFHAWSVNSCTHFPHFFLHWKRESVVCVPQLDDAAPQVLNPTCRLPRRVARR